MEINDRIDGLEKEIRILKDNLLDYICKAVPKDPNPQWTEERLRSLEIKVKILEDIQNSSKYNKTEDVP